MKNNKKIQKLIIKLEKSLRIKLSFTYLVLAIFVSFVLPHYTYAYSLDIHDAGLNSGDSDIINEFGIKEYNIFKLSEQALKLFSALESEKTLPDIKDRKIELSNYRYVTAYNVGVVAQTDNTPCIGASGDDLCEIVAQGQNVCAANFVRLGTYLEIEGFGKCIVLDRMNARYTSRVDIAMGPDEIAVAREFGLRRLKVGEY